MSDTERASAPPACHCPTACERRPGRACAIDGKLWPYQMPSPVSGVIATVLATTDHEATYAYKFGAVSQALESLIEASESKSGADLAAAIAHARRTLANCGGRP